tara:strand:- start:2145 stop:2873 length:729 start_codon:yes stop_codon:yes gene_type:complete
MLDKVFNIKDHFIISNIWISRLLRLIFKLIDILSLGKFNYKRIDIKNPHEFTPFSKAKNFFINGNPCNLLYLEQFLKEFLLKIEDTKKYNNQKTIIGVHVRRGDFAGAIVDVCNKNYFQKAIIEIFRQTKLNPSDVQFLIFCQEEEWPKKNIFFEDLEVKYIIGNHLSSVDDFKEMCNCDHLIVSNSSYSWWAAQKIMTKNKKAVIICPDLWWDKIDINQINIFPKNWIVVKTGIKARAYLQ